MTKVIIAMSIIMSVVSLYKGEHNSESLLTKDSSETPDDGKQIQAGSLTPRTIKLRGV